ncbi:MAG TPA: YbhB/YbcL family Raf kinase inhibitor-like protein [Alphaproteobacteria bacterium]|nr:YbhB/YbcL family Raf kinase inhibitor-like protein [Alphaproteobacteria bacterium]
MTIRSSTLLLAAGVLALACWGCSALAFVGTAAARPEPSFSVSSPAFADGGLLARKNAAAEGNCGGENVSPPLQWFHPPAGTRSFAVIVYDPDGKKGLGSVHWIAYGIPASVTSLAAGAGSAPSGAFTGGMNSAGLLRYRGPCPPAGDQPHHYIFSVYALDADPAVLVPGLTRDAFLEAIQGHSLAAASIVGRYGR